MEHNPDRHRITGFIYRCLTGWVGGSDTDVSYSNRSTVLGIIGRVFIIFFFGFGGLRWSMERGAVDVNGGIDVANEQHLSSVEHHGPVAEVPDPFGAVANDHHGPAECSEVMHLLETLELECLVANGQNFIDQQHIRVEVGGHGKTKPSGHARGVVLDLEIYELLESGEVDDLFKDLFDLGLGETQYGAVEVDVLPAG